MASLCQQPIQQKRNQNSAVEVKSGPKAFAPGRPGRILRPAPGVAMKGALMMLPDLRLCMVLYLIMPGGVKAPFVMPFFFSSAQICKRPQADSFLYDDFR
jgi:hypothetical protein